MIKYVCDRCNSESIHEAHLTEIMGLGVYFSCCDNCRIRIREFALGVDQEIQHQVSRKEFEKGEAMSEEQLTNFFSGDSKVVQEIMENEGKLLTPKKSSNVVVQCDECKKTSETHPSLTVYPWKPGNICLWLCTECLEISKENYQRSNVFPQEVKPLEEEDAPPNEIDDINQILAESSFLPLGIGSSAIQLGDAISKFRKENPTTVVVIKDSKGKHIVDIPPLEPVVNVNTEGVVNPIKTSPLLNPFDDIPSVTSQNQPGSVGGDCTEVGSDFGAGGQGIEAKNFGEEDFTWSTSPKDIKEDLKRVKEKLLSGTGNGNKEELTPIVFINPMTGKVDAGVTLYKSWIDGKPYYRVRGSSFLEFTVEERYVVQVIGADATFLDAVKRLEC